MKKNVAIIITKLNGGGAERVAANLSLELAEHFNIILIVFDGADITYPYGGEMIDLKLPATNAFLGKISTMLKRIIKVRRIKKKRDIHCAISLMDGPNLVNVFSRRSEIVISSIRIFMSASRKKSFMKSRIPTFLATKLADKVIALSEAVRRDLIENYKVRPDKAVTIYNSCNIGKLMKVGNPVRTDAFEGKGEITYATMGRHTHQKGHWHLIRAFKKVVSGIPGAKLYMVGDGEYRHRLQTLAEDLGIGENIVFTGFLKNPHGILEDSDVFVFPSRFEGLGNALLEALACEKPVISSDCDAGPREILAPDTDANKKTDVAEYAKYGVLVPVCDSRHFNAEDEPTKEEEILADVMIEFSVNKDLIDRYSKLAAERSTQFLPEAINEKWLELINF